MINAEQGEIKTKIKDVMVSHLITLGYPEIQPPQVMNELKPMWVKLEEANLILPGMTFAAYYQVAEQKFIQMHLMDFFQFNP